MNPSRRTESFSLAEAIGVFCLFAVFVLALTFVGRFSIHGVFASLGNDMPTSSRLMLELIGLTENPLPFIFEILIGCMAAFALLRGRTSVKRNVLLALTAAFLATVVIFGLGAMLPMLGSQDLVK